MLLFKQCGQKTVMKSVIKAMLVGRTVNVGIMRWRSQRSRRLSTRFITTSFQLNHRAFTSRIAARTAVMDFIEVWYNRKCPHTANGGLSPRMLLDWDWEQNSVANAA